MLCVRKEAVRLELAKVAQKAAASEINRDASNRDASNGGAASEQDEADIGGNRSSLGAVLPMHRKKKGHIWTTFDLSKEKPTCTATGTPGGVVCGVCPSTTGGTSNYWSHLYVHHRPIWLELKHAAGHLTESGEAELTLLQGMLLDRAAQSVDNTVFSTLPEQASRILDRVVTDWIIDTDGDLNDAELPSFRALMRAASSQAYSGCCHTVVAGNITQSSAEGLTIAVKFHDLLAADGLKPTVSGDLWSKKGCALLGLISHGILAAPCKDGTVDWVMLEVLTGAVPCAKEHHTGEHVGALSNDAWAKVHIEDPVRDIFRRKSDEGSNMIKVNTLLEQPLICAVPVLGVGRRCTGPLCLPRDSDRHW